MKNLTLKEMTGKQAKEGVIRACATEPPKRHFGQENQINNVCK